MYEAEGRQRIERDGITEANGRCPVHPSGNDVKHRCRCSNEMMRTEDACVCMSVVVYIQEILRCIWMRSGTGQQNDELNEVNSEKIIRYEQWINRG